MTPTAALEEGIAPYFQSLSRRMLARFRRYGDEEVAVIREFLTSGAREMRDEAAKLAATESK